MNVSGSESSKGLTSTPPSRLNRLDLKRGVSPLISATEWAKQRRRIKQLYLVDGLTRLETRVIMKNRYGFVASDVQYKYQIKKWSFQKSLTSEDRKRMASVKLRSQEYNSTPVFLLCGRPIQKAKISRKTKGISGSKEMDIYFPWTSLSWYDSDDWRMNQATREWQSASTIKCPNPEKLHVCCITCLECELDFHCHISYRLWSELFDEHIVEKHAKLSHKFALIWCVSDPALSNPPDHQIVHEWDYGLRGDDFDTDYAHYPNVKMMLTLLGSMSSTSVVQEEPQAKSLWLVDLSDESKTKSLALITRLADETPQNLLQSLLIEGPCQNADESLSSTTNAPGLEMVSINPGAHILSPMLFGQDELSILAYASTMSLRSTDYPSESY